MSELTLSEARKSFELALSAGTTCPCCDRSAKRYRRNLSPTMVMFLARLVRVCAAEGGRHVHYSKTGVHARDYPWLAPWGLAETEDRGMWRPTVKGLEFIAGKIRVPKYRFFFDSDSYRDPESELVDVHEIWRDKTAWEDVVRHQEVIDFFERETSMRQARLF